jgi:sarcosine oxidase, subunit gamma
MDELKRISPLPDKDRNFTIPNFQLRELEGVTKLRVQVLRARGNRTAAADPLKLPSSPNTTCGEDPIALWRAPDDWLVYSPALDEDDLSRWVDAVESTSPLILTDVSSASAVLELQGPRTIDILMRDCTLDLDGDAIKPGSCAQTLFAQTTIVIHRPETPDTWRLFVERSVTRHVWDWLVDSALPT